MGQQSRVYRYGCLLPAMGLEVLQEQLRYGRVYQNALIESNLRQREVYRRILTWCVPSISQLRATRAAGWRAYFEARRAFLASSSGVDVDKDPVIAALRVAAENASAPYDEAFSACRAEVEAATTALQTDPCVAELVAQKDQLAERAPASAKLQQLKREIADFFVVEGRRRGGAYARAAMLMQLNVKVSTVNKEARALISDRGRLLSTGNYLLRERAVEQQRKGAPPRFKGYDGTGVVGDPNLRPPRKVPEIMIPMITCKLAEHHGVDAAMWRAAGLSDDAGVPQDGQRLDGRKVRISEQGDVWRKLIPAALPAAACSAGIAIEAPLTDGAEAANRTRCHVRVAKDTWMTFPLLLHRPLPPDGTVTGFVITVRKLADKPVYTLNITVKAAAPCARRGARIIAVDQGWRRQFDGDAAGGLLMATTFDGAGHSQVLCPASVMSKFTRAAELEGQRDANTNALVVQFGAWIASREVVPAWLTEWTTSMARWRGKAIGVRLRRLCGYWKLHRFATDEQMFGVFDAWLKQDRHLWRWSANLYQHALDARRKHYANEAKRLLADASVLAIEDLDKRGLAQSYGATQRSSRHHGAPSEFIAACMNYCAREGLKAIKVNKDGTSRACSACGDYSTDKTPAASAVYLTCKACGVVEHRDERASRNIHALAREQLRGLLLPSLTRRSKPATLLTDRAPRMAPQGVPVSNG